MLAPNSNLGSYGTSGAIDIVEASWIYYGNNSHTNNVPSFPTEIK